jgi:DNA-binding CsgD family transcriptional regulator
MLWGRGATHNPSNLGVMGERERQRCRERLEALRDAALGPEDMRHTAIAELRRAVGFDRWCWPLTDPDTGLATSGIGEFDFAPSLPRLVALEEQGDVSCKPELIVGLRASAALSAATGGDLARSTRWRECLRPYGIGDELMTACRDPQGCWGSVELMRDAADRPFTEDEVRLLEGLAPTLGTLVRRSVAREWTSDTGSRAAPPPGTLILDERLSSAAWTPALREWLTDLAPGGPMLPPAMYELGARVLTPAERAHGLPPRVRLRTPSGRWSVVEAAPLEGEAPGRVAVTVRAATGDEIFDVLSKAHGLSARERQLAALVRTGLATGQLARAMRISPYTVQDHFKSIFTKTGLRSRRELVSHLVGHLAAGTHRD